MPKTKEKIVKSFPNGAKVVKDGREFNAYDGNGSFLGWTEDRKIAEYLAETGRVNSASIDHAGELSRWQMWNDGLDSKVRIMADTDGRQIMSLDDGMFMIASRDKSGWTTVIMDDSTFEDQYWDDATQSYDVRVLTEGQFRLE